MSMFRSQDMHLCKVIVTKDKAYNLNEALGMLNEVFFINLNKDEHLRSCHIVMKLVKLMRSTPN